MLFMSNHVQQLQRNVASHHHHQSIISESSPFGSLTHDLDLYYIRQIACHMKVRSYYNFLFRSEFPSHHFLKRILRA